MGMFKKGDIVICVDNKYYYTGASSNLTINKSYRIIETFNANVYVINDMGERDCSYGSYRFVLNVEAMRTITIDNILL